VAPGSSRSGRVCWRSGFGICRRHFGRINEQGVQAAAIGTQDLNTDAIDLDDFVALGHATEVTQNQTADGIEFLVGEIAVERNVEIIDLGTRLNRRTRTRSSING
jgi:hypothetical protein